MKTRECIICGKEFEFERDHARCCSSNCRHKLRNIRKQNDALDNKFKFDLWQNNHLMQVRAVSPDAAKIIDEIRVKYGSEVADMALNATGFVILAMRSGLGS